MAYERIHLRLNQVFYSQSSINDHFHNGRDLEDEVRRWRQYSDVNERRAAILRAYPTIRAVLIRDRTGRETWEERWHTLDHRRLWVMNRVLPPDTVIPVNVPRPANDRRNATLHDDVGRELCRKYTTHNDGVYIVRLNHPSDGEDAPGPSHGGNHGGSHGRGHTGGNDNGDLRRR